MRIIQLMDSFGGMGGLERFVFDFSKQIVDAGHETVICTTEPHHSEHTWGSTTISEVCLGRKDADWKRVISQLSPDLVIWHGLPATAEVVLKLAGDYPIVSTMHGALCPSGTRLFRDKDEICLRKGGYTCLLHWYARQCGFGKSPVTAIKAVWMHQMMIDALGLCRRIYAVSDSVKKFLVLEGLPTDKVCVFDNTLGLLERLRTVTVHPINIHRQLNLLYVGRLVYSKGTQYLIDATQEFVARGEDIVCHIVGDGWHRSDLERQVERLNLTDQVIFHGRVAGPEVQEMYVNADIVVVPSVWPEPSALVVPEARQQGKPVVVFDAGGLPEWVEYLSGVYVAKRADTTSLIETILHVRSLHSTGNSTAQPSPLLPSAKDGKERVNLLRDCESWMNYELVSHV